LMRPDPPVGDLLAWPRIGQGGRERTLSSLICKAGQCFARQFMREPLLQIGRG
jgi:hypothetical protein